MDGWIDGWMHACMHEWLTLMRKRAAERGASEWVN